MQLQSLILAATIYILCTKKCVMGCTKIQHELDTSGSGVDFQYSVCKILTISSVSTEY